LVSGVRGIRIAGDSGYTTARSALDIDNVLIDHDGKFIEDVGWLCR